MESQVGIRELRQQASQLLKRVRDGEPITVTDRGQPIARIVPVQAGQREQLVREGGFENVGDLSEK